MKGDRVIVSAEDCFNALWDVLHAGWYGRRLQ